MYSKYKNSIKRCAQSTKTPLKDTFSTKTILKDLLKVQNVGVNALSNNKCKSVQKLPKMNDVRF
jgi:hypothetical protein